MVRLLFVVVVVVDSVFILLLIVGGEKQSKQMQSYNNYAMVPAIRAAEPAYGETSFER